MSGLGPPSTPTRAALTPAAERILDAASELFYNRGLHAVGVELIAETAGTTKKTLYDRFGSKDALIALYLQRRAERWQAFVLDYLDEHAPGSGTDRPLAPFHALDLWMSEHRRGCAFVNAQAELTDPQHPAIPVIRAEKNWVRDLYERLLTEAGYADAAALAGALMLLHEGAITERTVSGRHDAVTVARGAARILLADPRRR
jgi:AcrR family transcriptional regulator